MVQYLTTSRQTYSNSLIATIFDLAKRKILSINHEINEKKGFFGNMKKVETYSWEVDRMKWNTVKSILLPYEENLLDFIFNTISNGKDSVTLSQIKKKRSAFTSFFKKWKKDVKISAKEKKWFDQESIEGMKYSLIVTVALGLLNVPFFIFYLSLIHISEPTRPY